jgi:hypothetical protein
VGVRHSLLHLARAWRRRTTLRALTRLRRLESKEIAQDNFGYAHLGSAALTRTRQINALVEAISPCPMISTWSAHHVGRKSLAQLG